MEMWTKAERESARLVVTLTYNMGKVKKSSKPIRIKVIDMPQRDYDKLMELLNRYDMNTVKFRRNVLKKMVEKTNKPKMKIVK